MVEVVEEREERLERSLSLASFSLVRRDVLLEDLDEEDRFLEDFLEGSGHKEHGASEEPRCRKMYLRGLIKTSTLDFFELELAVRGMVRARLGEMRGDEREEVSDWIGRLGRAARECRHEEPIGQKKKDRLKGRRKVRTRQTLLKWKGRLLRVLRVEERRRAWLYLSSARISF